MWGQTWLLPHPRPLGLLFWECPHPRALPYMKFPCFGFFFNPLFTQIALFLCSDIVRLFVFFESLFAPSALLLTQFLWCFLLHLFCCLKTQDQSLSQYLIVLITWVLKKRIDCDFGLFQTHQRTRGFVFWMRNSRPDRTWQHWQRCQQEFHTHTTGVWTQDLFVVPGGARQQTKDFMKELANNRHFSPQLFIHSVFRRRWQSCEKYLPVISQ